MIEDKRKRDQLYADALRAYLEHRGGDGGSDPLEPDPDTSRITLPTIAMEATVALRTRDGVPLGTVSWFGDSVAFEPPTKVTVVDHFHGLRATKP
jgi:hypothetical protein